MSEIGAHATAKPARGERASLRARDAVALELVAVRGKDVVGVRHLIEGGMAWVGPVSDAIARVPARDLGGRPHLVGEVRAGTYSVSIPPRARARFHGADGIPRLMVGPRRVELREGERAVVVLGGVQIRARLVPRPAAIGGGHKLATTLVAWLAVVAVVYVGALAFTTALAQGPGPALEHGAIQRATARFLPHAAR